MKVGLLVLIVVAALVVIACGVWVTRALIAELWPRKPAAHPVSPPERTPVETK